MTEKHGDERLGIVIREARHRAGLSLTGLGDRTAVGKARLSRYENAWVMPSIGSLVRIGDAVGLAPSELLRRAGL